MNSTPTLARLAIENEKLRNRLQIAEQWIGREIRGRNMRSRKDEALKHTRAGISESEDEIRARILKYLGDNSSILSGENLELLVESEINFSHLAKKKDLDGFMLTNAYQKVLENIFEEHMTRIFREKYKKTRLHPTKNDLLEKTLYKVIHQDFRLSLGKIYQIMERILGEDKNSLISLFRDAISESPIFRATADPLFWELFTDCIETGAFGEKRHSGKINFSDVQLLRKTITGNYEEIGFLKILLQFLV